MGSTKWEVRSGKYEVGSTKCQASCALLLHRSTHPPPGRGNARPEPRKWKTFQTVQISPIVNRQQSIVNALFLPIMCNFWSTFLPIVCKMLACRLKMNGVALKCASGVRKVLKRCQTFPNLYLQPGVFVVLFRYELPNE